MRKTHKISSLYKETFKKLLEKKTKLQTRFINKL